MEQFGWKFPVLVGDHYVIYMAITIFEIFSDIMLIFP
jgi:hypothetical protein